MIHRDFKEENVFIDVYGRRKLGDFGCAKLKESESNQKLHETPQMGNKFFRSP